MHIGSIREHKSLNHFNLAFIIMYKIANNFFFEKKKQNVRTPPINIGSVDFAQMMGPPRSAVKNVQMHDAVANDIFVEIVSYILCIRNFLLRCHIPFLHAVSYCTHYCTHDRSCSCNSIVVRWPARTRLIWCRLYGIGKVVRLLASAILY